MSERGSSSVVVVDTMAVSAIVNATRAPTVAGSYRTVIAGRPIVVSFASVTELRYGALKAGWGDIRRQSLERDLSRLVVVQPDDELIRGCAQLRVDCEQIGHSLGQKIHEADRWIAATAIMLGVDLISDDGVFDGVPGLVVTKRASSNEAPDS